MGYVPEETVKPIDVKSMTFQQLKELHQETMFRMQNISAETFLRNMASNMEKIDKHNRVYYQREREYAVSSCEECQKGVVDISANFEFGDILPLLVKNIDGVEKVEVNESTMLAHVAEGCDIKDVGKKVAECVKDYVKNNV